MLKCIKVQHLFPNYKSQCPAADKCSNSSLSNIRFLPNNRAQSNTLAITLALNLTSRRNDRRNMVLLQYSYLLIPLNIRILVTKPVRMILIHTGAILRGGLAMSTVGRRSVGITGRVDARLCRVTELLISIGIDIGESWEIGRENSATVEDGDEAWDAAADDSCVDFG
jgi:hypothetical protein